ncbi:MAG: glycosyltransferase family 4 protein [Coriobacteriia bacterium]|nr:glycosyltransferase family 4 protein [Coriobacteriia bacterium]
MTDEADMMAGDETRSRVFYLVNDYWACGWYRCYVPGVALKSLGYKVVLDRELRPEDVEAADVVVFQQLSMPAHIEMIRASNDLGKLTVVEIDDDLWNLVPTNPGHLHWGKAEAKRIARECVAAAQLVTTPTHALAEKLRTMNPNVRVLPNMLPTTGWDYPEPKAQREDAITIGWAGSYSHLGDLRVVNEVLLQLLDHYPHVEVAIVGKPDFTDLDEHERIRFIEPTDINGYPKLLEQFDIGLIPLADNLFNRAKSDLKFVEYSRIGIPSVASKLEPYLRTVKHGENGFLASSPKDWLKHVTRLIEDVELRRSIGAAAQAYAKTRTIDTVIDRWERAYGLTRP